MTPPAQNLPAAGNPPAVATQPRGTGALSPAMVHFLAVTGLGITQIIGYGTLYYAFSVLAPAMGRDLAWPSEWIFGAFSTSLLAAGLIAPRGGRWIDRFGAGRIMAAGSAAAALALVICAQAPGSAWYVAGIIGCSIASTFVQYSAAFALLVQIEHARAERSITYLTLIAGFASTIFWPLTSALQQHLSWQAIYLVFALLHVVICLPIHLALSRLTRPGRALPAQAIAPARELLREADRARAFRIAVVGFAMASFMNNAVLVHMLTILPALGLGAASVLIGTFFGPSQVLGRLINMIFGRNITQTNLAVFSSAVMAIAVVLLIAVAPSLPGAIAFSIVFGLGGGLNSIVQGTLPLALFGRTGYGERLGKIMAARLAASAAAPFALAFLISHLGVVAALALTSAIGFGAALAFMRIGAIVRTTP